MDVTYSDLWGNTQSLTDSELAWFKRVCDDCQRATGIYILIECENHESIKNHKEALGIIHTDRLDCPLDGDTRITVDTYFIHECYEQVFNNQFNLSFESIEHVISHEFAHLFQWRHCRRHTKITETIYQVIRKYQGKI